MSRPGTPTPSLLGDASTSTTVTVAAGKREVAFVLDQVSASGGRIRGELTLSVGQQIRILLTDPAGDVHEIEAEVADVRVTQLLNEEADVRFLSIPQGASAYLAELVDAGEQVGGDFDDDNEQPTQRRSAPQLPTLEDLDPPTLRKPK
jgi:hypothetical protein